MREYRPSATRMLLSALIHLSAILLVTSEVLEAKTDKASFAFHLAIRPPEQVAGTRHHWLISTNLQGKVIRVNVVDVNLGPDCGLVSIRVLDGADSNASQLGVVCGTTRANFTSSGSAMMLELVEPDVEGACPDCYITVTYWAKYPDTSIVAVIAPPFAGTLLLTLAIVCFIRCRERRNRARGALPDSLQSSPATLINMERDDPPSYDDCFPNGSPYDSHSNGGFEGDEESGQEGDRRGSRGSGSSGSGGGGGDDDHRHNDDDDHMDLESLPPSYGSVQRKYKAELTRRGFFFSLLSTISGLAPVSELPEIVNQTITVDPPTAENTVEADPNADKTVSIQVEPGNPESSQESGVTGSVATAEREVAGSDASQGKGDNSARSRESQDADVEVHPEPPLNDCDDETHL